MDYAHLSSKPSGEVILSIVDNVTGALIPALKIVGDGHDSHMFLNRAGIWREVAIIEDIPSNAILSDNIAI